MTCLRSFPIECLFFFGLLEDAQKLFNEITKRDIVSWNTMIRALRTHRYCKGAF